jgi:hypothetical protein
MLSSLHLRRRQQQDVVLCVTSGGLDAATTGCSPVDVDAVELGIRFEEVGASLHERLAGRLVRGYFAKCR